MATAAAFDPCRCFYNEEDAFPPLPRGYEARLLLDQQTQLVYGLGDGASPRAFQYVVVDVQDHDRYTARYFDSVLPKRPIRGSLESEKEMHFYAGHRVRNEREERLFAAALAALRARHGDDLLRAFQTGDLAADGFAARLWADVVRVLVERVKSLGGHVPSPRELLLLAQRTERRYPPPARGACCAAARRRWWRFRLRRRLRHHFPVLSAGAAYLLSEDVAYILRYPTHSNVV